MASWSDDPQIKSISRERPSIAEHMRPPSIDIEKLAGYEALKAAFPNLNFREPATDEAKLQKLQSTRGMDRHL
jgi:hypothetical protein